ncbi:hypothetical protein SRABI91_02615 [Rhodococcoides fascians]|nr:hypothetical protein SRABI91_02615 [Rhodococcus fascians]
MTGIEWDSNACKTRRAAKLATRQQDVRDLGPEGYPAANILAGGPPCQTFTVAGTGVGRKALDVVFELVTLMEQRRDVEVKEILAHMTDERTGLVLEPLRWALAAIAAQRPYQAIVLEQVPAVAPVWESYADVLRRNGYSVDVGVLRTEQFGVPQTRRRAILIARLGSKPVALPKATHRSYRKGSAECVAEAHLLPWVTMAKALDQTDPFEVVSNYGTGGIPSDRGRRSSNLPAFTVTGKVSRNRIVGAAVDRFTLSQAGRLQTFPSDFPWSGADQAQQVGNAIPPRLAAHVLSSVLSSEVPTEGFLDEVATGSWWDHVS